jgi:hypothetical protein
VVAALVVGDVLAAVLNPDVVAIPAQLDALMNEAFRGAVEVGRELEIAIQWNAGRAPTRRVKGDRRQRPQLLALVRKPLGDDVPAGCVAARQRDPIAPGAVDVVELAQRGELARRPEPRLQVADRALDGALLARRRGRAGRRVRLSR